MVDRYAQDLKLYQDTSQELKEAFKERNQIVKENGAVGKCDYRIK